MECVNKQARCVFYSIRGVSFAFLVLFHRAFLVLFGDEVQYLSVLRCFTSWVVPQGENISVTDYRPKLKQKGMF